ncbi:amidohydrolase [Ignavibacteriales bacterium]
MRNLILLFVLILSIEGTSQVQRVLFNNGIIYTGAEQQKYVECVAIEGNKIVYAGAINGLDKINLSIDKTIDLNGALMLPGLTDNHVHFTAGGFYLGGLNLRPAKSTSEFKSILKEFVAKKQKGEWITGGDWDHEAWEVKNLPTKEMIDEFTGDNPVFINRFDGHLALANSAALRLAGIDSKTPVPAGGEIVLDKTTGEPTGILKDNAMDLVSKLIPAPSEKEIESALNLALEEAAKLGVTMVHDITYKNDLKVYQKFEKKEKLTCRIYCRLPIAEVRKHSELGIENGFGSDFLKIGSLKAFADGSLGSSTAWFFDPYESDHSTCGLPMEIVTNDSLRIWSLEADRAGLQLSIHAIGDKANSFVLDMFEEIVRTNPKRDRRFRIEHAQHLRKEDVKRFKDLAVIASAQPYHLIDDGVWAHKRIGTERLSSSYRFKEMVDLGVNLCFGSDWTVAPLNPLLGIYAAVTRRTLDGKNPDGWIPEEKITVEDAVKAYTINNAYAAFMEDKLGTIEVGKYADFTILDKNIFTIDPEQIKETTVLYTIVDGKIVYKK